MRGHAGGIAVPPLPPFLIFLMQLVLVFLSATSSVAAAAAALSIHDTSIAAPPPPPPPSLLVQTTNGPVQGVLDQDGSIRKWLGVPFAAAPTGDLRFKAPVSPTPWQEPLDSSNFGPACPQNNAAGEGILAMDEDCLNLNVFAPVSNSNKTSTAALPVIVWIYGGSFVHGGDDVPYYRGQHLANHSVVFVSINYRLGALGWLVLNGTQEQVNGNLGLLDQQFALQWVQKNIAAFGGDPGRVTLQGESAGAISACFHSFMPSSKGLFRQIILESGPCLQGNIAPVRSWDYEQNGKDGLHLAALLGCTPVAGDVVQCLRTKSVAEILKVQPHAGNATQSGFSPVIDGILIPQDPFALFAAGHKVDVPMLVGTNMNEGTLFVKNWALTPAGYVDLIHAFFGSEIGEKVLQQYPSDQYPLPAYAQAAAFGHFFFVCPTRRLLRSASTEAFQYQFAHVASYAGSKKFLGVYHSSEIPFVFGNPPSLASFTDEEKVLSSRFMDAWTSFAAVGAPTGSGFLWENFSPHEHEVYLQFNTTTPLWLEKNLLGDECDFWDSVTR